MYGWMQAWISPHPKPQTADGSTVRRCSWVASDTLDKLAFGEICNGWKCGICRTDKGPIRRCLCFNSYNSPTGRQTLTSQNGLRAKRFEQFTAVRFAFQRFHRACTITTFSDIEVPALKFGELGLGFRVCRTPSRCKSLTLGSTVIFSWRRA